MANTLTVNRPRPVAGDHRWLKATGAALLVVALVVGVAGTWLLRQGQPRARPTIEGNLLALVAPEQVPPYLSLLMLSDFPADQVWQEPLRRQQWDGALAMWLFGPARSDRDSLNALAEMAAAQRRHDPNAAAALLLAAADVARLSPELSDRDRAKALLELGEALRGLGLEAAAVAEWRQASILAHYGPSMPALYRATLLQTLSGLYRQVGASHLAERARTEAAQVGSASDMLAVPERIVLDTEALPTEPADLAAARERRRLAAQAVGQALGGEGEGAAYAALREALSAEGLLHRGWMAEQLAAGPPREVQAALLLHHISWLQRERLLAWGLGGPQFPTWAERRAGIEAALHEAWDALETVRMEQSIRDGVQERATLAQRDWWATRLIQARLLRDPGLDQSAIVGSMVPNNADGAGGVTLRLDWIQGRFWRVPREFVGTDTLPE